MAIELTRKFEKLGKGDAAIAGGKGASLGEMTQAGIPVPPGFVVLADSFNKFLEETQLEASVEAVLKDVNFEDVNSVNEASEKLRAMILNAEFPQDIADDIKSNFKELDAELVAVRSSATAEDASDASWAGELESYLNTTQETLLENVKKCWSSLFTPRAIFYRFEKKMHDTHVAVAVVVQKMVQSETSGITFTVHPVTQDHNQMVIEAGWGLGEAIVGGKITPDSFVIDKTTKDIIDSYISDQEMKIVRGPNGIEEVDVAKDEISKQKFPDEEVRKLADVCMNIEKHYGFPCDIEWAHEKGNTYIVQSRPITTLS